MSTTTAASKAARIVRGTDPPCYVFESAREMARHVAQLISNVIREKNSLGQDAVLGLPTGSTPISVYRELIRMHQEEGLDFSQVTTFNLDEYFGIPRESLQSYYRWMHHHFFDHVNIPADKIHIPDSTLPADEVDTYCRAYEDNMRAAGGLDVVLLGIGGNGHIGFNEPQSQRESRTRMITLDPITRRAAASDFFGIDNVPTQAITMGLATILDAKKVVLMALGEHKADIIRQTAEGPKSDRIPATHLKDHADTVIYLDDASANDLTAEKTPWVIASTKWTDEKIKRAVLWLCEQTEKALLKLDDEDFRHHNLHQLLRREGSAEKISQQVFQLMMNTIVYHPAGQNPTRILCFSPHPDDDVISMGGTLIRLNEDGHEVHVAYMTSGNIAVFDHDAKRIADLVTEYNRLFGIDQQQSEQVEAQVNQSLNAKKAGDLDIDAVLKIKSLIRWSEAKVAAEKVGCDSENCHFLDLPFYRTGTVDKNPWGAEDAEIIENLLLSIQPEQVYVAGDLSDPHGTHRMCAEAIFHVLDKMAKEHDYRPQVLQYRGAWQEYALDEIEVAVPLSPSDMMRKRKAIFMHESQKDEALFPGPDPREFWQRAFDRNRNTAIKYNAIGLPEYFAIEAFVRWQSS